MRRKIENERDARACLRAAKAAGVSAGEWARDNGVDGRSLNAWRINLTRAGVGVEGSAPKLRLVELVSTAPHRADARYVVHLDGAVRRLGLDPVDGHVYLLLNKRRRIAKAIWFDGSGWHVLAKRLEAGSFQLPPIASADARVQIDGATFASLLAGIDFTAARRGWCRRLPSR